MEIREGSPWGVKRWRTVVLFGALLFAAGGALFFVRFPSVPAHSTLQKVAATEDEPLEEAARPSGWGLRPSANDTENSPELSSVMRKGDEVEPPLPAANEAEDEAMLAQEAFEQQAIDRFDQNARDFEDRLTLFEAEKFKPDEAAASLVSAQVLSELSSLEDQLEVKAECTASVCSIEMNNGRSVGSLVASVAGWLRRHPASAIGDPLDEEDDQTMRVLFLRDDAPGLKQP